MDEARITATAAHIWLRMSEIYGTSWQQKYGPVADSNGDLTQTAKTWGAAFLNVTESEFLRGFAALVRSGNEWPPSAPAFYKLCCGEPEQLNELTKRVRAADAEFQAALPKTVMTREERQAALEKFRQEVGKVLPSAKPESDTAEQGKPEPFRVDPTRRAGREKQFRELGVKI
ncbi:MAG: hypothetical protein KDK05_10395 [Candidatus Competibacteraceae bacterium]|nr:hypothetical protein [Candidatus Competibacteraceae bacterium]